MTMVKRYLYVQSGQIVLRMSDLCLRDDQELRQRPFELRKTFADDRVKLNKVLADYATIISA